MSDLIADLKAALETKNARVRECEDALVAAKAERDSFATNIANEPGIAVQPKTGKHAPAVQARREKVLELSLEGKSISEIVRELGANRALIDNDMGVLRRLGKFASNAKPSDTAPASAPSDDDAEDGIADPESPPEVADEPDSGNEKGASKDALMAEVTRQQGGIRGKVVILGCTTTKGHRHTFRVDRMGIGTTTPDSTGHGHHVYRFAISATNGHTHDLVVKPA